MKNLQEFCRERNLPTSGRKNELVNRLLLTFTSSIPEYLPGTNLELVSSNSKISNNCKKDEQQTENKHFLREKKKKKELKLLILSIDDSVNLFSLASFENPPDNVAPLKEHLLIIKNK